MTPKVAQFLVISQVLRRSNCINNFILESEFINDDEISAFINLWEVIQLMSSIPHLRPWMRCCQSMLSDASISNVARQLIIDKLSGILSVIKLQPIRDFDWLAMSYIHWIFHDEDQAHKMLASISTRYVARREKTQIQNLLVDQSSLPSQPDKIATTNKKRQELRSFGANQCEDNFKIVPVVLTSNSHLKDIEATQLASPSSVNEIEASDAHNCRPISLRFHPVGSDEAKAFLVDQLDELVHLSEVKKYESVLIKMGEDLVTRQSDKLQQSTAYSLGKYAYEKERFDVAEQLLARVVADINCTVSSRTWAKLYLALSKRGLGKVCTARKMLLEIVCEDNISDCIRQAKNALMWLNLNDGNDQEVNKCIAESLRSSMKSEQSDEVELISRVLSTVKWLRSERKGQLSHTIDRASSDGVVASIDRIQLSRCGKVFELGGWFVDPGHQLRHLFLVRGNRVWNLDLEKAAYLPRPDLDGLVKSVGGNAGLQPGLKITQIFMPEEAIPFRLGEEAELFVVLANGNQFCLSRTILACELSINQIKAVLDTAINESCVLKSPNFLYRARELWKSVLLSKLDKRAEHYCYGKAPKSPELSVLVPLYGRVDFMEYQLNWFNAWKRRRTLDETPFQLIYVLDDPRMKHECLALAKRCNTLYKMPFELVINSENLGFAGANNCGASFVNAPFMLLLNSDVLPARDDAIEIMLSAMQQHSGEIGALGAQLLFDNGAVQHQGMEFVKDDSQVGELGRIWLNDHPLKGVKVEPQQCRALIEVEAATAACLLLPTNRFKAVGGFSSDYIVGDFEDSDLCMKLREMGFPIMVDLSATFYHLERQSVNLASSGDAMKMKIVAANAITHHQRWCSAIERLHQTRLKP